MTYGMLLRMYDGNNILNSVVSDEGFDNIIEVSTENANFWIYSDIVKSTTHILNGEEKDQHFEYEEFGKIHNSTSSTQDGTITNRFAGRDSFQNLKNMNLFSELMTHQLEDSCRGILRGI